MKNKLILIGLDGCDFRIINGFIDRGLLPTFSEILDNGCYGILNSTIPPNSLPAWTSILTGVNPGKHGIIDFMIKIKNELKIATSRYRMVRTLWSILDRKNIKQIIINEPVTYPPEKLKNGIMLTGFMTPPNSKNFIHPKELINDINKTCKGYETDLPIRFKEIVQNNKMKGFYLINKFAKKIINASLYLSKNYEWDFLSIFITSTDRLQHYYYHNKQKILYHYKLIDKFINKIINLYNDANLIIVSDHGFGPLKYCFYLNTFLKKINLLKENKKLSKILLNYSYLLPLQLKAPIYKIILKYKSLTSFLNKVYSENINYIKSIAYIIEANGGIYINEENIINTEEIIKKIKNMLNKIEIIQRIYERNKILWGPYKYRGPNLFVIPKYGYEISQKIAPKIIDKPIKLGDIRTGTHRPEGIFMAYGPNINKNEKLNVKINTWDISPTIIHLVGLSIPNYMDGQIIKNIFK